MNKHIKNYNNFIKENYSINENESERELDYIRRTLTNEFIDVAHAKLEYNGELIIKIYNDHIETNSNDYELDVLDETTLSHIVYEVEQWEIDNEKTLKDMDDERAWNYGEDEDVE